MTVSNCAVPKWVLNVTQTCIRKQLLYIPIHCQYDSHDIVTLLELSSKMVPLVEMFGIVLVHFYFNTCAVDTVYVGARLIIKVSGHQHQRLAGDYDLEIGHF